MGNDAPNFGSVVAADGLPLSEGGPSPDKLVDTVIKDDKNINLTEYSRISQLTNTIVLDPRSEKMKDPDT
jgi:hypothetical protein